MAQETLVFKLGPDEQERLEERVRAGAFDLRGVDHARFSARGEGVVATLYRSGKLVVQGSDARLFADRYLGGARPGARPPASGATRSAGSGGKGDPRPGVAADAAWIGSDEVGKGDFLGPMVVAAVRAEPAELRELARSRVADSKEVPDARTRVLGPALRSRYRHAVRVLDPAEYNPLYERVRNLNKILADLHADAIRELARPGDDVLVDKFAGEGLLRERLEDLAIRLRQAPRAERDPAVAAASVIARAAFLERMDELSDELAVDLAKGAGPPADVAAREVVRVHGEEGLRRAAKLHFKNAQRLTGPGARRKKGRGGGKR